MQEADLGLQAGALWITTTVQSLTTTAWVVQARCTAPVLASCIILHGKVFLTALRFWTSNR
jgi:hypothetical protein